MKHILFLTMFCGFFLEPLDAQQALIESDGSELGLYTPPGGGTVPLLHFRNQNTSRDWIFKHDETKFHLQIEGSAGSEKLTVVDNGRMGMGTTDPLGLLDLRTNSTPFVPHLLLRETEAGDYARITFDNKFKNDEFWTLAAKTSIGDDSEFNLWYQSFGNVWTAKESGEVTYNGVVSIKGDQLNNARLTINSSSDSDPHLALNRFGINSWNIFVQDGGWLYFTSVQTGLSHGMDPDDGGIVSTSDRRKKKDIRDMNSVLDKVNRIKPRLYRHKHLNSSRPLTMGFIAQEVITEFPSVVKYLEGADEYGVNYSKFGVIAIKAIQEQQEIINKLKSELSDSQKDIERLYGQLSQRDANMQEQIDYLMDLVSKRSPGQGILNN